MNVSTWYKSSIKGGQPQLVVVCQDCFMQLITIASSMKNSVAMIITCADAASHMCLRYCVRITTSGLERYEVSGSTDASQGSEVYLPVFCTSRGFGDFG